MQVILGEEGLTQTFQQDFPKETKCVKCGEVARIGFVAHELENDGEYVCSIHDNEPKGDGYWLHDSCAVAVYFCTGCLETTSLYNQA